MTKRKRQQGMQAPRKPRYLLFSWFHLEQSQITTCANCEKRPGEVRFDDYQPTPDMKELMVLPLTVAEERVYQLLLEDQTAHAPRIHSSMPYCFPCVAEHVDAVMMGEPEHAGMKTVIALTRFEGHPGVALIHDTKLNRNAIMISMEETWEGLLAQFKARMAEQKGAN